MHWLLLALIYNFTPQTKKFNGCYWSLKLLLINTKTPKKAKVLVNKIE